MEHLSGGRVEVAEAEPEEEEADEQMVARTTQEATAMEPHDQRPGTSAGIVNNVFLTTAQKPTLNIGGRMQPDLPVKTPPALNREEWKLLIAKYSDETWLTPFPWDPKCRLDPEDYCVPLTLDFDGRDGEKRRGVKAELDSLFDCPVRGGAERAWRVLLRGDGGFGKTTLCTKIVYDWSWRKSTIRALPCDSTLLVLYKLRDFVPSNDLEGELVKFIYENHSVEGKTVEGTREAVRDLGKDLVLVLDGYDELDEDGQRELQALVQACKRRDGSTFADASLLVTSRDCCKKEFLDLFQKHYRIGKLTRERAEQLVLKYFDGDRDKAKQLDQKYLDLEENEATPLVLFVLCWVNEQKDEDPLSTGKDLFYRCCVLLARRCNHRQGLSLNDEQLRNILFLFGLLCHCRSYSVFGPPSEVQNSLVDRKTSEIITNTGLFRLTGHPEFISSYQPIHGCFLESLEKNFREEAYLMFKECSTVLEYERFVSDILQQMNNSCLSTEVEIHFPAANKAPVFTVKRNRFYEFTSKNGRFELGFPSVAETNPLRRSLLITCSSGEVGTAQKVLMPGVLKLFSRKEEKIYEKVMSFAKTLLDVTFEDELDERIPSLVRDVFGAFTAQEVGSISFFFCKNSRKRQESLISLSKALDAHAESVPTWTAEHLVQQIKPWTQSGVTVEMERPGHGYKGLPGLCFMKSFPYTGRFKFTKKKLLPDSRRGLNLESHFEFTFNGALRVGDPIDPETTSLKQIYYVSDVGELDSQASFHLTISLHPDEEKFLRVLIIRLIVERHH